MGKLGKQPKFASSSLDFIFMSCFLCVSSCAFWVSMASDERIQTLVFLLEYVQYHLMRRYFHFILKFSVVFSIWMFTSNVLKLHSFIYLWLVHATVHMLKSVDTLKELFLSFYHLNPVIKHRSLGMAANVFIWGAILLTPWLNFLNVKSNCHFFSFWIHINHKSLTFDFII